MTVRTSSKTVTFAHQFLLKGDDRILAAGDYRVVTDEELIEQLSFPVYRRVATMIFVPADSKSSSSVEMVTIDPHDLQEALDRDAVTQAREGASPTGDDPPERLIVALEKFIERQNIAHYADLLVTETDPIKRIMLQRLLAEEKGKQVNRSTGKQVNR